MKKLQRVTTETFCEKKSQGMSRSQFSGVYSFLVTNHMCRWVLGSWSSIISTSNCSICQKSSEESTSSQTEPYAYISQSFLPNQIDHSWQKTRGSCKRKMIVSKTREGMLQALHKNIRISLRSMKWSALKYVECKAIYNHGVLLHSMLSSYIAEILEFEALLSAKQGTVSSQLCHNCLTHKVDFSTSKMVKSRGSLVALKLLKHCLWNTKNVQEKLIKQSLAAILQALQPFFFCLVLMSQSASMPCFDSNRSTIFFLLSENYWKSVFVNICWTLSVFQMLWSTNRAS